VVHNLWDRSKTEKVSATKKIANRERVALPSEERTLVRWENNMATSEKAHNYYEG